MIAVVIIVVASISTACILAVAARPPSRLWPHESGGATRGTRSGREWLGWRVRSKFGFSADPERDRAIGTAMVVVVVLGAFNMGLAVVGLVGVWGRSVLQRRRAAQRATDRVGTVLADVIDLFAVALLSGNTVGEAVRQVGEWSEGDVARAFAQCASQAQAGRSLSDSLEALPAALGTPIRPLVAALVATERYGAPITTSLAQLAIDTRTDRRRRAEAAARRLPVLLLFPLVVCVLPAFLLVTVVPVIFDTLTSFDLTASP